MAPFIQGAIMANLTFVPSSQGLTEILNRATNKSATDTWKLHVNSNSVVYSFTTVIGDVTEAANTTAQDITPGNLDVVLATPRAKLVYDGNIVIPIAGGPATQNGYYITNQAGTVLIGGVIAGPRTLADGDDFVLSGFEISLKAE